MNITLALGIASIARVSSIPFEFLSNSVVRFSADSESERLIYSTREFNHRTFTEVNLTVSLSQFFHCQSDIGGAIDAQDLNTTIADSVFSGNSARIGGAVRILKAEFIFLLRVIFVKNTAEYCAGFHSDTYIHGNNSLVDLVNASFNYATRWVGAMRIDHAGGSLKNSCFEGNSARVCGAFFEYTWTPAKRFFSHCIFKNNSAYSRGGAVTIFHCQHNGEFSHCLFFLNRCNLSADSISIESIFAIVDIFRCVFENSREQEVKMRFDPSTLTVSSDCTFDTAHDDLEAELANISGIIVSSLAEIDQEQIN
jgi:hypothetical protein